MSEEIDPERYYSFTEAARLIPSCRAGKQTSTLTLLRWVKNGELKAEKRQRGKRTFWFVQGIELLRLQAPQRTFDGVTRGEVQRGYERAMETLRRKGVI